MSKILICGDSFAADWSKKYEGKGWVNMIENDHVITNIAEAGVSEYKIYKQLISFDLTQFDLVIVAHTSPYRVVTRLHPVHYNNSLHKHADLLFGDIEYHYKNKGTRRIQRSEASLTPFDPILKLDIVKHFLEGIREAKLL
jgi:hypothetical protein